MGCIKEYWKTIDYNLKKYTPSTYETLAPPATDAEIYKLIKNIALPIPDSLIESLLIHNGQIDSNYMNPFLDYQHLLSSSEIIENYSMMNDIFPDEDTVYYIDESTCRIVKRNFIWNKKWMPFTNCNGDGLLLDFTPAQYGEIGQIFYRPNSGMPPDKALASSYEDWLNKISLIFENGDFQVEDSMVMLNNFTFNW